MHTELALEYCVMKKFLLKSILNKSSAFVFFKYSLLLSIKAVKSGVVTLTEFILAEN